MAYDLHYNEEALKKYHVEKATARANCQGIRFCEHTCTTVALHSEDDRRKIFVYDEAPRIPDNTSRGGTVDETALIQALRDGVIAGAALDVFETEPVSPDNPLLFLDNVFKTPHIATNTNGCALAGFDGCIKCLKEYEAGQVPEYALNPGYVNYLPSKRG